MFAKVVMIFLIGLAFIIAVLCSHALFDGGYAMTAVVLAGIALGLIGSEIWEKL